MSQTAAATAPTSVDPVASTVAEIFGAHQQKLSSLNNLMLGTLNFFRDEYVAVGPQRHLTIPATTYVAVLNREVIAPLRAVAEALQALPNSVEKAHAHVGEITRAWATASRNIAKHFDPALEKSAALDAWRMQDVRAIPVDRLPYVAEKFQAVFDAAKNEVSQKAGRLFAQDDKAKEQPPRPDDIKPTVEGFRAGFRFELAA